MEITININDKEWNVLRPILEPMLIKYIKDPNRYVDFTRLEQIKNGNRAEHVLLDGKWGNRYTKSGRGHCVMTINDFRMVTKSEFMSHKNSGELSWLALDEFRKQIIEEEEVWLSKQNELLTGI